MKLIQTGYRSGTIHIIIAKTRIFSAFSKAAQDAVHCLIHILHQPWIMQVGELRAEILFGFFKIINTSLYQDTAKRFVYLSKLREVRVLSSSACNMFHLFCISISGL
jgi:hypothetical protein